MRKTPLLVFLLVGCMGSIGDAGSHDDLSLGGGGDGPDAGTGGGIGGGTIGGGPLPGEVCDHPGLGGLQARLLSRTERRHAIEDLLGIDVGLAGPDGTVEGHFDTDGTVRSVDLTTGTYLLGLAEGVADEVAGDDARAEASTGCSAGDAECLNSFAHGLVEHAFRRAPNDEDRVFVEELFASAGGDAREGLQRVVMATVMDPRFLYLVDYGTPESDVHRMAFAAWGYPADATLVAAARAGEYDALEARRPLAERLIADPRARFHLAAFFEQWLETDTVLRSAKDPASYPDFDAGVREAMVEEQRAFIDDWLWNRGGRFEDLFGALPAVEDERLVEHYGSAERVEAGILALGAVTAGQSVGDSSNPIQRGLFVLENLLCIELGDPPNNVNMELPEPGEHNTTRERFAAVTSLPQCQSCHASINALGFSLESFDGDGRWRETENGHPVDATTTFKVGDSTHVLRGPAGLGEYMRQSDRARRCFTAKAFAYMSGRHAEAEDVCTVDRVQRAWREADTAQQMLVELLLDPSFQQGAGR